MCLYAKFVQSHCLVIITIIYFLFDVSLYSWVRLNHVLINTVSYKLVYAIMNVNAANIQRTLSDALPVRKKQIFADQTIRIRLLTLTDGNLIRNICCLCFLIMMAINYFDSTDYQLKTYVYSGGIRKVVIN